MEFLVEIAVGLPADMPDAQRDALIAAERVRGLALKREGTIVRIWRVPGRTANVGIWSGPDATALHAAISSLPLFPWIDARVTALATHDVETLEVS